ncbi:MAG: hypothetical protein LBN12_08860, partial [Clostridiales Family XIII bacterium]|nr:hypothetical protein [Clostridiales Family XIII bacterium]
NHLTKYGETVTVEIKGYFDDIIRPSGFRLNGGGNYTLKKGKAADTLIITEKGVGEIGRITKGSAVVTLPASLTDRLENGTHTIEILFEEGTKSGSGTAKVVVKRSVTEKKPDPGPGQPGQPGQPAGPPISAPDTADDMNLTLWFVLMAAALAALIAAAAMRRRLMKRPQ